MLSKWSSPGRVRCWPWPRSKKMFRGMNLIGVLSPISLPGQHYAEHGEANRGNPSTCSHFEARHFELQLAEGFLLQLLSELLACKPGFGDQKTHSA